MLPNPPGCCARAAFRQPARSNLVGSSWNATARWPATLAMNLQVRPLKDDVGENRCTSAAQADRHVPRRLEKRRDTVGQRAIFGRSYVGEPDALVKARAADEGCEYLAPALCWR